jgi:acyl-coenzyme A synthetase/AMP-(fatty) acid ligase
MDDVIIVSGHNLGTAPIEDSINLHPAVAESAIVGFLTILKEMHCMVCERIWRRKRQRKFKKENC